MEASMRCMRAAVRTTTRRGRIIVYSHGSKYIIFIKFNVKTARLIAYHVFVTIVKYTLCTGQLKNTRDTFFFRDNLTSWVRPRATRTLRSRVFPSIRRPLCPTHHSLTYFALASLLFTSAQTLRSN